MRIGIDASMLVGQKSGIGYYVFSLLEEISAQNPDTRLILYSHESLDDLPLLKNAEVRIARFPIGRVWMQLALPYLLASDRPDLFWGGNYALPLFPKNLKKVITIHDFVFKTFPETLPSETVLHLRLMLPLYLKRADQVLVDSENTARDLKRYYHYPAEKVKVLPLAARKEFFAVDKTGSLEAALNKYHLKSGYLLYVGTLEPRKGVTTLLEALSIYKARNGLCPHLVLAGKYGWRTEAIEVALDRFSLRETVTVLDYVDSADLPALYRGAELFIYPSFYEGFGLPLLEAMASGLPAITTTSSSLPEVGGDAVLYFEPGDANRLAILIETVLSDDNTKVNLSARGRTRAGKFSWQQTAKETMAVFKQILQEA